jgi:hypothetical protein
MSRPTFRPSRWPPFARRIAAAALLLVVAGIGLGAGYLAFHDDGTDATAQSSAPVVVVEQHPGDDPAQDSAPPTGFPTLATRNTTRIGGADPTADAAGVALASYPSLGGVSGPAAAILAPAGSWQLSLAATPLTADPVDAPLLLGTAGETPEITTDALTALAPAGLEKEDGAQLIAIGDVKAPDGLETLELDETDPAELAARVDAERARLTGEEDPAHLLVVGSGDAALAIPAAAWAARSGDPILFAAGDDVPEATLQTVGRHPKTPIYVLGPESAVSAKAVRELEEEGGTVKRIGAEDPVENAIAFATYVDGEFGWNINDPGHGLVIVNSDRPLDAAAAAPLSAGGKPGPLLLTDDASTIPDPLASFLADIQPGFVDDPTRAVYNHTWLLGDPEAISVGFQARVDELTKLAPVSRGTGSALSQASGNAESEPPSGPSSKDGKP